MRKVEDAKKNAITLHDHVNAEKYKEHCNCDAIAKCGNFS